MRILLSIASLLFFSTIALSDEYPTCDGEIPESGDILTLAKRGEHKCWQPVGGEILKIKKSLIDNGNLKFVYIFGMEENDDFDPIFNVKIKEIAENEESVVDRNITLLRDKIVTKCSKYFGRLKDKGEFKAYGFLGRGDVDGFQYNKYHKTDKQITSNLNNFHIYFKNSLNKCIRTDDDELKKFFAINDIDYQQLPGIVARLFGAQPAMAAGPDANRYRKISVRIARGAFRGDALSGNFNIPANGSEYDIIVQDLSTYPGGIQLRDSIRFRIEK